MLDINIDALKQSLAKDQVILRERLSRLQEFKAMDPRQIQQSDRYLIEDWSLVSTREFVKTLEQLEDDAIAADEQKDVMIELGKLIHLHDHLKQLAADLRDYLNEILGPLPPPARRKRPVRKEKRVAAATAADPSSSTAASTATDNTSLSNETPAAEDEQPAKAEEPVVELPAPARIKRSAPADKSRPTPAAEPVAEIGPPSRISSSAPAPATEHATDEPEEEETPLSPEHLAAIGTPDPQGVYALLNLPTDCTDAQILTAIKKRKAVLHPDRHPTDGEASSKFSDFVVLVEETVATPQKRAMYDSVQDEDDMRDLVRRIGRLEAA